MESLLDAFAAALRARRLPPAEAGAQLEALVAAARRAWPGVEVPEADFSRALVERIDPGEDPAVALSRLRAQDVWLACACARGDARALQLFEAQLLDKVPALIHRVDPGGQLAAEVRQELRDRLLVPEGGRARIEDYSGRGDLLAWLRVAALRTALRLRRAQKRRGGHEVAAGAAAADLLDGADPERDYLRLRYRGDYERAFADAMAQLEAGQRLLLKLHYVDALSLERLAALQRVHRATVARRLAEARRGLLARTRELLQQRLRLSESEFESILALVRSQLVVSVRSTAG
jgi:RNA polymerase sigma-70 factor (ECF subfamily)